MFGQAFAFLSGDLLFQQSPSLPALSYLGLLPVFWLISRLPLPGLTLLAWVAGGFFWGLSYAHLQADTGLDERCLGETLITEGVVSGLPQEDGDRLRFEFDIDRIDPPHCIQPGETFRARVNWYQTDQRLSPGQRWRMPLKFRKTRNFYNPGGFDYEASLLNKGIRYTAYVRDTPEPLATETKRGLDSLRINLSHKIESALPESEFYGILQALVVGDRSGIPDQQWQTLRRSGTLHLMAISGLHIGMLAGMGYFLGAGLWRLIPGIALHIAAPRVGAVTAILFAIFYAALAGFSLPTQRALVMLSVAMLALLFRRNIRPGHTLALAVFIVLLLDPFSVTQPGFWLSFIAVGLLLFTLDRNRATTRIRRWGRAQWVLLIGLLPLNLIFFQGTTLAAPLANLVAIPWVGLTVLPPALLGSFLQGIGVESAVVLLRLAAGSLTLLWPLLDVLQAMPMSWISVSAPGPGLLAIAVAGIVLLLAPSGWPGRAMGAIFLLPMLFLPAPRPEGDGFWLEMLDVGEGLSVVVRTRRHSLVYDTGPRFSPRFDTGSAVVLPYLRQNGIHAIDTLLISHGDNDHIGGSSSLLEEMPASHILSSVPEKVGHAAVPCRAGQSWNWDGVQFQILHPPHHWPFEGNNTSCVLLVENKHGSALLTGDIESITEFRLIKELAGAIPSDVLLIPHHGSHSSSTREFIRAVDPELALVSTGYRNRFGFPKPDILARYAEEGIQVINTAEAGAIHIEFPADNRLLGIRRYLEGHRRYWYSGLDGLP